eukprot:GEMP01047650.1.p1 GENE.GEMP01047650.1~~GEMP01047650.1.p1  ORF type:complete len:376 (+),score=100.66 GEMP01047650.1:71-1198(+)
MVIPSNERFVHAFAKRDSLAALQHLLPLAPAECVDRMLEYLASQLIERTIIDVNDHAMISAESRALAQERAEDEERNFQMKSDSSRPSPFKRLPRSVLGKRETALTVAVKTRHAQFTRLLCAQNGVHVDRVSCGTEPAVSHAYRAGPDGEHLPPLVTESMKEIRVFPIVIALENNDVEIVQTLIDHGVQVQQHQNLVITASNGYPECLDAVLKAHKRLKGLAGEGLFWLKRRVERKTGRHIRLPRGMLEDVILPYVIPEQEFNEKEMGNALLCAASCGNTQCVKILLDAKAYPSFYEEMSRATILMWAAETGAMDAIQLLLDYHADPDAEDVQSMSALDYAALYGYDDLVELLRKHSKRKEVRAFIYDEPMPFQP